MVPTDCFEDYGVPLMQLILRKNNQMVKYQYYAEYFHRPILLLESEYSRRSDYTLDVKYKWYSSPVRDYTVKVYSKMDVPIKNENGD